MRKNFAILFILTVLLPFVAYGNDADWTTYTTKLVNEVVSGAQKDGVAFPKGFGIRIGIHPSKEPNLLGGVVGAPDTLIITQGFVTLAEKQLDESDYRAILAHELGHMILGHKLQATGKELERQEFAADQFARERLGEQSGACAIAHALHQLAEPSGGWAYGSLERKRELANQTICRSTTLTAASR